MSKLAELLASKKDKGKVVEPKHEEKKITRYNRIWLSRQSDKYGYIISSNEKKVDGILTALNRKDGHCPCGGTGDQFLCPCVIMREKGICKCGLYENITPVKPIGVSKAEIRRN